MKKLIILLCAILAIQCVAQKKPTEFENFLKGFQPCNFPLNTSSYFNERNIYSNNKCDIKESEFNSFLKRSDDKFWKYVLHSKSQDCYFNYVRGCKSTISESMVGVLYFRAYYSESLYKEKNELVLAIFNKAGRLISDMPIAGGYGDSITFTSIIHNPQNIEVKYVKYSKESEKKITNFFEITSTGEIEKSK